MAILLTIKQYQYITLDKWVLDVWVQRDAKKHREQNEYFLLQNKISSFLFVLRVINIYFYCLFIYFLI